MKAVVVAHVALALGLLTCPAWAASDVVTQPDWIERPNVEDLSAAYPRPALDLLIAGTTILTCVADDLGRLQCTASSETPKGLGFAAAALSLVPKFRIRPATRNGQAVGGATLRIPLRFTPPPFDVAPPPVSAAPLASRQLAAQLLQSYGYAQAASDAADQAARELEFVPLPDVPDENRTAAADALREAIRARQGSTLTVLAGLYADAFTEAELREFAAASPAARAVIGEDDTFRALRAEAFSSAFSVLQTVAHDSFCAIRQCEISPTDIASLTSADGVTIGAPEWSEGPDEDALWRVTPKAAVALRLGGAVRMTCRVTQQGLLEQCRSVVEAPAGLGFGAAAVSLTSAFRLQGYQVAQGAPGESVAVRLVFAAPDPAEPYERLKPRSPAALELGRRFLAATAPHLKEEYSSQFDAYLGNSPPDMDPGVKTDVAAALTKAKRRAADELFEDLASAYAGHFSEEQLRAALAFVSTPAGRSIQQKAPATFQRFQQASSWIDYQMRIDARDLYCRTRDCTGQTITARGSPVAASAKP